jgi:hypothetical protein
MLIVYGENMILHYFLISCSGLIALTTNRTEGVLLNCMFGMSFPSVVWN